MTPEKAKTKWCSQVQLVTDDNGNITTNRMYAGWDYPFCLADGCMAWRWTRSLDEQMEPVLPPTQGYCGLAGEVKV